MNLRGFYTTHAYAIKWIGIALAIKSCLFILFTVNFLQNWPQAWIVNSIFIESGDTSGYYKPVQSFVDGNGYSSFCRMPGLLPIYAPLYFLFGETWGKTFVILLQFFLSSVSVYVLSKSAQLIFNNTRIFYITFFVYAFSSFVSIWDHYGYSDSFATSFIIYSFYFLVLFIQNNKTINLLYGGFFAAWAVFFRPIYGLIIASFMLILLIMFFRNFKFLFRSCLLFMLPCIVFVGLWSFRNYNKYQKIVVLEGSFSDCYPTVLAAEHLAIRNLIIAWGGDFQEWSLGTEAEWFFSKKINYRSKNFFTAANFSSGYNLDSLVQIKINYDSIRSKAPLTEQAKLELQNKIIRSANNYRHSYIAEHPFRYYFFNRLKFFQRFTFPTRLDNLPFPKVSVMKLYQKVVKGGYLLFLNFISLTGILGIFVSFSRKSVYGIIPLAMTVTISSILGFVEQRYLVPAYPFFCIYSAFMLSLVLVKFQKKTGKTQFSGQ